MPKPSAACVITPLTQTYDLLTVFPKLANEEKKKKNRYESVMGGFSMCANCTTITHGGILMDSGEKNFSSGQYFKH